MSRESGAWLGGVCVTAARRLGWNTTGVRAAAVLALLVWPLITIVVYLAAAWALDRQPTGSNAPPDPVMEDWDRRLAEVDRHLRR